MATLPKQKVAFDTEQLQTHLIFKDDFVDFDMFCLAANNCCSQCNIYHDTSLPPRCRDVVVDEDRLNVLLDHLPSDVVGQRPGTGLVQDGLELTRELPWLHPEDLRLVNWHIKQH